MRILILGGDGMLGHQLLTFFSQDNEVKCTLRSEQSAYEQYGLFSSENSYYSTEFTDLGRLEWILQDFKPEVVINCIGIVKQRKTAKESIPSIEINSLIPHKLALSCEAIGAKFIHISTDCVFSGKKGNYQETDPADAEDLYGKSKYLGEVQDGNALTLRTSIIGHELSRYKSLLEWFLAQDGEVKGFSNAIYTGFTTNELARIIKLILDEFPEASGLYQVSSDPICKYELLQLFKKHYQKDISILRDEEFCNDKSLDSSRFREAFKYTPPSWDDMIKLMAEEHKQA